MWYLWKCGLKATVYLFSLESWHPFFVLWSDSHATSSYSPFKMDKIRNLFLNSHCSYISACYILLPKALWFLLLHTLAITQLKFGYPLWKLNIYICLFFVFLTTLQLTTNLNCNFLWLLPENHSQFLSDVVRGPLGY